MSLSFLGSSLFFLSALIALSYFAARAALEEEVGQRLMEIASASSAQIPSGLVARFSPEKQRTRANLESRLRRVAEAVSARRIFLCNLSGQILVDSSGETSSGSLDRDLAQDRFELERVAEGKATTSVLYQGLDGLRYKRGFAPVQHEGRVVAALGVEGSAQSYEALDALGRYLVILGLLALLAMSGLVLISARTLTAPLACLVQASQEIGAGILEEPIPEGSGGAELMALAHSMEQMRCALLQRDRELQMMLGGIAHEVRNPLGGMELFLGLLKEDLEQHPDELSLLARVEHELGNLKRIVEEFLEYARRGPIQRLPLELAELISEVAPLVEGLEIEGRGAKILGDRLQLRRLLLNLARNAEQAGASHLRVQVESGGLRFQDNGPGVPKEEAQQIFEAFFTTKEQGTGLGLALCARIAEAHGGELRLENSGEPGACFYLSLSSPPEPASLEALPEGSHPVEP